MTQNNATIAVRQDSARYSATPPPEPPPSAEYARKLIGCVLLDYHVARSDLDGFTQSNFQEATSRDAFRAITALEDAGEAVNVASVMAWLRSNDCYTEPEDVAALADQKDLNKPYLYAEKFREHLTREDVNRRLDARRKMDGSIEDWRADLEYMLEQFSRVGAKAKPAVEWDDLRQMIETEPEQQRWIFDGAVPVGSVSSIVSWPGLGKSYLLATLWISKAIGRALIPWFDPVTPGRVMVVLNEDAKKVVHRRMHAIFERFNVTAEERELLIQNTLPAFEKRIFLVEKQGQHGAVRTTPAYKELKEKAQDVDLLLFDPMRSLHRGTQENDSGDTEELFDYLRGLVRGRDAALICVHHVAQGSRKDPDSPGGRGSTAEIAAVRSAFTLTEIAPSDPDVKALNLENEQAQDLVRLNMIKNSYGAKWKGYRYLWRAEHGVLEEAVGIQEALAQSKEQRTANLINALCEILPGYDVSAYELERRATATAKAIRQALDERLGKVSNPEIKQAIQDGSKAGRIQPQATDNGVAGKRRCVLRVADSDAYNENN